MKIRYIGRHESYPDRINRSKAIWNKGDVKEVPENMVRAYLKHKDSFESAEEVTEVAEPLVEPEVTTEDEVKEANIDETRMAIEQLTTKDDIIGFIKEQWGIEVDLNKSKTKLEQYREVANMYIDTLGLVENDDR